MQYTFAQNTFLSPSDFGWDLGVVMNPDLSWEMHISKICKKARQICGWILNVFKTRDKTVMLTLLNSLVRSDLEYCCPLWDPFKIKSIDEVEQIQRSFTHKINGMHEVDYWTRLKSLDIPSLQRRREKLILILVWKIKNNFSPNDINLEFVKHNYSSKIKAVLKPMPRKVGKLLTLYENSFVIKAAKLWNVLPAEISNITNFNEFLRKLECFLRIFPDEPPVNGYFHKNNNSILSYIKLLCKSVQR